MTLDTAWRYNQLEAELAAAALRSTVAIRERCAQLLDRARRGESQWFEVHDDKLEAAAHEVADATKRHHHNLHEVPFQSQWRHLEAGGVDRRGQLEARLQPNTKLHRAHALVDFAVVSVLLSTVPPPTWKYVESQTGHALAGAEGLAVAAFHAFASGLFSSDKDHPLQVDATALRALQADHLASALQVSEGNPLSDVGERAILLRRFGEVMQENPSTFGPEGRRPSGLFDLILGVAGPDVPPTADVSAHDILSHILMTMSGLSAASNSIGQVPLGDCWRHAAVRGTGITDGWVPFHELPMRMTFSLLEPFIWSGSAVHGLDTLTALPDADNGGLLLDAGVLALKDEAAASQTWQLGDEIVVEWRALTVALFDELATHLRKRLHLDASHLPLASVLHGSSHAARDMAARAREGRPTLRVVQRG